MTPAASGYGQRQTVDGLLALPKGLLIYLSWKASVFSTEHLQSRLPEPSLSAGAPKQATRPHPQLQPHQTNATIPITNRL